MIFSFLSRHYADQEVREEIHARHRQEYAP